MKAREHSALAHAIYDTISGNMRYSADDIDKLSIELAERVERTFGFPCRKCHMSIGRRGVPQGDGSR
jgi:hypothetical protein